MSDTPRTKASSAFNAAINASSWEGMRQALFGVTIPAVDQAFADMERELAAARAECERYRTALLGVKSYREANPLGGPAKVFDAMADCIRAGDSYEAVLKEYGFVREEDCGPRESE